MPRGRDGHGTDSTSRAPGGLHRSAAMAGRGRAGARHAGRHRCDDAGSQCGAAEPRPAGLGRGLRRFCGDWPPPTCLRRRAPEPAHKHPKQGPTTTGRIRRTGREDHDLLWRDRRPLQRRVQACPRYRHRTQRVIGESGLSSPTAWPSWKCSCVNSLAVARAGQQLAGGAGPRGMDLGRGQGCRQDRGRRGVASPVQHADAQGAFESHGPSLFA